MRKRKAKLGDWLMTCERSGKVYFRSEMRQEWTGAWVHYTKWEARHPQDIIKAVRDDTSVFPSNQEDDLVFVNDYVMSALKFNTSSSNILISGDYSLLNNGANINLANQAFSSGLVFQDATRRGVKFKLYPENINATDNIYIGFFDGANWASSTKSLIVTLTVNGSLASSVYIGNSFADVISVPDFSYTSGDVLGVSIDSSGKVWLSTPTAEHSYTTSPAVSGLSYFGVWMPTKTNTSGKFFEIISDSMVYPQITEYTE